MTTRVNKTNRKQIEAFVRKQFDVASKKKGGQVSLIDIWETETAMEKEFGISDYMSQVISWGVLKERHPAWDYSQPFIPFLPYDKF